MSKQKIVTVKLKSGEDLIGLSGGIIEDDAHGETCLSLMRPIKIKRHIRYTESGYPVFSYVSDLYSLYGSVMTCIPMSIVASIDIASEFFSVYYNRTLGELLVIEERIQEVYIDMYENDDIKSAMEGTDSIYLKVESSYLQ